MRRPLSPRAARALAAALAATLGAACGPSEQTPGVRNVEPTARVPVVAERVAFPGNGVGTAVWASPEGGGVVALRDGRIFAVSARGELSAIDRAPGEEPRPDDLPVSAFAERGGAALGITPGGARLVQNGLARRAELPMFLARPRAFTRFGAEAMWATPTGLFLSEGDGWFRLDLPGGAPVTDADELVPVAAPGALAAWARSGATVRRVRVTPNATRGMPPDVAWSDLAPAMDLGGARAIGALDATRGAVATDRGVTVITPDGVRHFRRARERGAPVALGAGGGWAWVAWDGSILRTDGDAWEVLVTDPALTAGTRIAVNAATGSSALLLDANGQLLRVEATETLHVSGLRDGAVVLDTSVELEAVPLRTEGLQSVAYVLDDRAPAVATRTSAPWGWGPEGARARELVRLAFGAHTVTITARYADGRAVERTLRFEYTSPLGRVPTYAMDILPLFNARCARCHANGVARDLSGYDRLRMQAVGVRATVREGRMPPDLLLDPQSAALFTAWVDGRTPP